MSEIGNQLIMPEAAGAPSGAAGSGPAELLGAVKLDAEAAKARYEKLKEAEARVNAAREQLDHLATLKDVVTQEDVIKSATKLVAGGADAGGIAGMLADMPPDGDALAGWVESKDLKLRELEGQLESAKAAARFQMGSSALQHAAALQIHHELGGAASGGGNPLMQAAGPGGVQ